MTDDERDRLLIETAESTKSAHLRISEVRDDVKALSAEVRNIPQQVSARMNGLRTTVQRLDTGQAAIEAKCDALHAKRADSASVHVAKISAKTALRVALIGLAGTAIGILGTLLLGC